MSGSPVYVVWHDMIDDKDKQYSVEGERHRENCTIVNRSAGLITLRDSLGETFTITEDQLISIDHVIV